MVASQIAAYQEGFCRRRAADFVDHQAPRAGKTPSVAFERPRPCERPVEIGQRKQRRDHYERDARQYCVAELTPRHPEQRVSASRTCHAPTGVRRSAPVTLT